jgi:di/tricarboxylate transporter
MIITRCCTSAQAMKSIDWNIIIVFAGSVCIGKAIEQTGIAQAIANGLLEVCGTNPYIVLFCMCLVATFITEFISNTAAGAMFYPIAMSAALALGVNPLTFCVALMIAASSSFATPIGSPTHTLVYVPGGYKFSDFLKVGLIMNLIILVANIFITTIVFPF